MKKSQFLIAILFAIVFLPIITMLVITSNAIAETATATEDAPTGTSVAEAATDEELPAEPACTLLDWIDDELVFDVFIERAEETEFSVLIPKKWVPVSEAKVIAWFGYTLMPVNAEMEEMALDIQYFENIEAGRKIYLRAYAPDYFFPGEYDYLIRTADNDENDDNNFQFCLRIFLQ